MPSKIFAFTNALGCLAGTRKNQFRLTLFHTHVHLLNAIFLHFRIIVRMSRLDTGSPFTFFCRAYGLV
jgi:hypothetical protein